MSFRPRKAPCGDIFGDINSLKHLATLVPGVMLDILQQVSGGCLPSLPSSILG